MRRIIAKVTRRPDGSLGKSFYCVGEDGRPDRGVTDTLLDLIAETVPPSDISLEKMVQAAESGAYVSPNPALPDWSVNDKSLWLSAPMAEHGFICISNENAFQFSLNEGGLPQQFTFVQFQVAMKHWREFSRRIVLQGRESLVDQSYEVSFPDADS